MSLIIYYVYHVNTISKYAINLTRKKFFFSFQNCCSKPYCDDADWIIKKYFQSESIYEIKLTWYIHKTKQTNFFCFCFHRKNERNDATARRKRKMDEQIDTIFKDFNYGCCHWCAYNGLPTSKEKAKIEGILAKSNGANWHRRSVQG